MPSRNKKPTSVNNGARRQRILYLHAKSPSIRSPLIGFAIHEPVADSVTQIDPENEEFPYESVHDAVIDGWRVIHFPQQRAPFDDREIDILGFEFILERFANFSKDVKANE